MTTDERSAKKEKIYSKEFITRTDIQTLFHVGEKKASQIYEEVVKATLADGKILINGRISIERLYKMMGVKLPQRVTARELALAKAREMHLIAN